MDGTQRVQALPAPVGRKILDDVDSAPAFSPDGKRLVSGGPDSRAVVWDAEVGTPIEKVMSTFPAIDTAVDNIKICQGLERIASVTDQPHRWVAPRGSL